MTSQLLARLLLRLLLLLRWLIVGAIDVEHGEQDTHEAQRPTHTGRRIPKTRSGEYLSGSRITRAAETFPSSPFAAASLHRGNP
jgi:hypothetical protein